MTRYKVGDIVECQVTGIENYGIFVNIDSEFNGLIHISEISDGFVRNVNDYITVGEKILAKVLEIDEENMRIKLTIKDVEYNKNKDNTKIAESPKGFEPLAKKLNSWIKEKLKRK